MCVTVLAVYGGGNSTFAYFTSRLWKAAITLAHFQEKSR